jgi:subtilisin family serine protease
VCVFVVLSLTFTGISVGASAVASSNLAARFEALLSEATIDIEGSRFFANPAQQDVVMIKLPGDPVAVIEAQLGAKLPAAEKQAVKAELRLRQEALRPAIESLGGRVLGEYQVVYNGIKVAIPHARLMDLSRMTAALDVSPVALMEPDNTNSVPLIGAPAVWSGVPGFRGEGIKIGIIDTGIDYTHLNFGGPGTTEAYAAAHAAEKAPADPRWFGPNAPKVKGGIDLVGDAYNGRNTPMPDPNPLDCNGHGSHVAGTSAGFGVLSTGATYHGPYDSSIYGATKFDIGPGVAPAADLYAIRVFGCTGSTAVVVDAIEWAVDNGMDVINMSLGSPFGVGDSSSAEASNNAARAGVIVVASAGNSGSAQYITGSPAVASRAISVAANEPLPTLPGSTYTVANTSGSFSLLALNANERPITSGSTWGIVVLRNPDGTISLGCSESEYKDAVIAGKLVVAMRGDCARVDRAIFGSRHGAAAVAMINSAPGFPVLEGNIFDGFKLVEIPFLGVRGSDEAAVVGKDGGTATFAAATAIPNSNFRRFASFTSGGPRSGDSILKPDITAPGVSTQSTAIGTGRYGTRLSGTSMAAPHVAGVAALVRQAHPGWSVSNVKAAIVNTGDPSAVPGYRTSRGGTGFVQPSAATRTTVVAFGDSSLVSLSLGFAELSQDLTAQAGLSIRNLGTDSATFTLSAAAGVTSSPHTLRLGASTITVDPGDTEGVDVFLTVPAGTAGDSSGFREVVGLITLTPAAGSNGGISLRVPYYLVPRAKSNVRASLSDGFGPDQPTGAVALENPQGAIAGSADFYAWGLADSNHGLGSHDLRAIGVQSFAAPTTTNPNRRLIVFAVNTFARWSNPSVNKFDIYLDVNGDGIDDFVVVGFDVGFGFGGGFNGRMGAFVFNLATGQGSIAFFAVAPTDSSTLLLPVYSTQIGLSPTNPRFAYHAESSSLIYAVPSKVMPGVAKFNAYQPAISNGQFVKLATDATATISVGIDPGEWANTPALGLMIVVLDNPSGTAQARLLSVSSPQR